MISRRWSGGKSIPGDRNVNLINLWASSWSRTWNDSGWDVLMTFSRLLVAQSIWISHEKEQRRTKRREKEKASQCGFVHVWKRLVFGFRLECRRLLSLRTRQPVPNRRFYFQGCRYVTAHTIFAFSIELVLASSTTHISLSMQSLRCACSHVMLFIEGSQVLAVVVYLRRCRVGFNWAKLY